MDATVDYKSPDTFYRVGEGGETVPWRRNNRRRVKFVIQCICFEEKRGRGSAHSKRGKEHARRLLIPVRRGDQRMQRRGGVR
jgi:hypothetical protein